MQNAEQNFEYWTREDKPCPWREDRLNIFKMVEDSKSLQRFILKKDIKEEIKKTNRTIQEYSDKRAIAQNEETKEWYEMLIEDEVERKLKLQNKLIAPKDKDRTEIERAKMVPITNFLDFKGGFAKCLWHSEKTGSLHYISKTNLFYCFGCAKKGDVLDVVMQLNGCTLPEAIKIILQ